MNPDTYFPGVASSGQLSVALDLYRRQTGGEALPELDDIEPGAQKIRLLMQIVGDHLQRHASDMVTGNRFAAFPECEVLEGPFVFGYQQFGDAFVTYGNQDPWCAIEDALDGGDLSTRDAGWRLKNNTLAAMIGRLLSSANSALVTEGLSDRDPNNPYPSNGLFADMGENGWM